MTEISQAQQNPAPAAPGFRSAELGDSARARLQGQESETQQLSRQERAAQQGKAVSRTEEAQKTSQNQREFENLRDELQAATEQLNLSVPPERGLRFQVSGENQDLVIQVVNLRDDEVIRSIPPERLHNFREDFRELTGLLLDDKA